MDGDDCEPLRIPMYGEIIHSPDLEKKLSVADAATFLSKVGVCHWIAQSVSPTTKFTIQRIAQHMASPNVVSFSKSCPNCILFLSHDDLKT